MYTAIPIELEVVGAVRAFITRIVNKPFVYADD
jgi:hypothetical protein